MNSELDDKLNNDFKFIGEAGFYGKGVPIECGSGWFDLLYDAFTKINKFEYAKAGVFKVIQIKEKFGMLEIYSYNSNKQIDQIIAKCRVDSKSICEICGKPGRLVQRNFWYMTRCPDCLLKKDE